MGLGFSFLRCGEGRSRPSPSDGRQRAASGLTAVTRALPRPPRCEFSQACFNLRKAGSVACPCVHLTLWEDWNPLLRPLFGPVIYFSEAQVFISRY